MARREGGIDDYLEDRRQNLRTLGFFGSSREANKKRAQGPQGVGSVKRMHKPSSLDSGVRINPRNVQVTRTGLERRSRTLSQRSTRGYGGRRA